MLHQHHTFSSTADYSLQVFYDFYERDEFFLKESRHTVDIDFQNRFALFEINDVVWGAGYRYTHDDFRLSDLVEIRSPNRNDQLFSAFVQDEITLVDDTLWFTLGAKFEHNDYTGFEAQPTARIMWAPHQEHRLWAAVSRAVRTPSRAEHDLSILSSVIPAQALPVPPFFSPSVAVLIAGNDKFSSEDVISYEVGYRTTIINDVSIDFTAFYNDYSNLRTVQPGLPRFNGSFVEQPLFFSNKHRAKTYGFEIATVWQMLNWWRWDANYSFLKTEFSSQDAFLATGFSPQQRVSLRSAMSLWKNINLDVLFRYVDNNTGVGLSGTTTIDDYVSMDIRLAWRPMSNLELSLVGQNILASQHLEYVQEALTTRTEIDRGVYGKLSWQF
jgi:iron complex outermembrane receptor protein